jgi:hypothetical protein
MLFPVPDWAGNMLATSRKKIKTTRKPFTAAYIGFICANNQNKKSLAPGTFKEIFPQHYDNAKTGRSVYSVYVITFVLEKTLN